MRLTLSALLATAAVVIAAPASAAVVVTHVSVGDPNTLPAGQTLIADFNNPADQDATLVDFVTLTLNGATVGVNEGVGGYSGTLPNDPTNYLTVPGGKSATFTSTRLMSSFSLYMGSPDTYNSIRFIGAGFDQTINGTQMFQGDTSQAWSWGKRINFDFGDYKVSQVILSSSSNSFEVDNAAANFAAVPEPATWAFMIMGFGAAGAVLRRRNALSLA
ncbi:PEPxxWA-CTERM sorting domain-containing protein [Phenylobacterium kunshanense]|nr:PEPxxWA-CTERM sorting domain-containing protein [Phenylobacterium kunshanense]